MLIKGTASLEVKNSERNRELENFASLETASLRGITVLTYTVQLFFSELLYFYPMTSPRDDSTNGYDTCGQDSYLKVHYEFQKMTLVLIVCLQKICNFAELEGCSSIIEPAMPILILNFNWACQGQF